MNLTAQIRSRVMLCFSVVLVAGFITSVYGAAAANAQDASAVPTWRSGESPDIALVVNAGPSDPTRTEGTVADALRSMEGVAAVAVVPTDTATSTVYVTASDDVDTEFVQRVEAVASATGPEGTVVGGEGPENIWLRSLIGRQALTAVAIVILLCTACLALVYGWQFGLGVLVVLGGVTGMAGFVNDVLGVRFDGSILSTSLPAILSSFVVVSIIGYRIIHEVEETKQRTSAQAAIASAFKSMGRPVVWMLGQLLLAAGLVYLLVGSSSAVLSVLIGVLTGSIVGLTLVPVLVDSGQVSFSRPSGRLRYFLSEHHLGNTVKLGVGALVMIVVGVGVANSLGPTSSGLADGQGPTGRVGPSITAPDDLTRSVAVQLPRRISEESSRDVAKQVSLWPSVSTVQTGQVQVTNGEIQTNGDAGMASVFESLNGASGQTIFVVPTASSGPAAVNDLTTRLASENLAPGSVIEPSRLAAAKTKAHQGWLLIVLVALSGLYGLGIALPGLHLGGGLASVVAARLLVVLAVIGFSSFLIGSGSTDEVVLIVVLTMMLWAWMEASLGVTIASDPGRGQSSVDGGRQASRLKSRTPIRSASLGLALLAMSGATFLYASAGFLRPLGRVLVVVSLVLAAVINVIMPAFYQMLAANHAEHRPEENLVALARDAWLGRPRSLPTLWSLVSVPMATAGAGLGRLTRRTQFSKVSVAPLPDVDVDEVELGLDVDVDGVELGPDVDEVELDSDVDVDGVELDSDVDVDGVELGPDVELDVGDGSDAEADIEVDADLTDGTVDTPERAPEGDAASTGQVAVSIPGFSNLEAVGLGGFAVVYRATDELGREVAVKVLKDVGDEAEQRRFEREKEALQTLKGVEGVVDLVGSGVTSQGAPYLTTPYFQHGTVARTLKKQPFTWHRAYEISCQLAETLERCHERRIYHRDLKPSNVLLDEQDRPHLLDFGSTQIVDGRSLSTRAAFTPNYCPPEVLIKGNTGSNAALVDVYGLGILIWAMIAGRRPFVADRDDANEVPTVFNRVATEALPPLEDVPHWLGSVVEKATEKNPSHRFVSVEDMRVALRTRSTEVPQETRRSLSSMFRRRVISEEKLRQNRERVGPIRSEPENQVTPDEPTWRYQNQREPGDERYLDITKGLPSDRLTSGGEAVLKETESDKEVDPVAASPELDEGRGSYLPTIRLKYPAEKKPVEPAVPAIVPEANEDLQTVNLSLGTQSSDSIDWKKEVSALISADFDLASLPSVYSIDSAYFPDTEIYRAAEEHRDHYLRWGQKIRGDRPKVLSVKLLNRDAPTRLEVVVDHPDHRLIGRHGDTIEYFPGEIRTSVLWLVETEQGFRISAIVLASSQSND